MNEEDINKKAEKHCNEVLCNAHEKCNEVIKCRDWRSRRAGFFCGYEQALKDFEKEAEDNKPPYAYCALDTNCELWKDGFQKGAEFAYNKANEWHYVKDGDLPKEFDKPYLCYLNGYFEVGYFMAYKEQPWHFDNYYLDNEDVDAWKEIVLPELPKEIE